MAEIDYYFTLVSPWTYLGHRALLDLAAEHRAAIRYRPVMLGKVFENSGAVPLAQRPKARQDYRMLELQRWRARRGLPLNLKPKNCPTNPALADRSVIALVEAGRDPGAYMESVFQGCWAEERDIADRAVLAEKLTAAGHDAELVLQAADSEAAERTYAQNTAEAIRIDAIGSPTYVLAGEIFWGQDRLELVAEALESGREPYRLPA
jgi:2-hydroxychromene-2-carboxylate isomerase